jgi:oligopeptide/dipeptide ABC transporter ATP-binding protein
VGLIRPAYGTVRLLGKEIDFRNKKDLFYLRQNVGMVFQDPVGALNPRLTVNDIIEEALISSRSVAKEEFDSRIVAILEDVGLRKSTLSMHPRELSGGEKQRVSLARALVIPKKLLILDEPTSSLDMTIQAQVLNTLKELKSKLDLSYLFITHDINVIRYMSSRLAVLFYGKMMEVGNTFDVISSPKHPYSMELLSNIPQITRQKEPDNGHSLDAILEHHPAMRGCIYRNVCPKVFERCVKAPAIRSVADGHFVSCFLYNNDETSDRGTSGPAIPGPLAS